MSDLMQIVEDLVGEDGFLTHQFSLMSACGDIIERRGVPYISYTACAPSSDRMSKIEIGPYQDHVRELLSRCPDGDLTLPTEVELKISLMEHLKEGSARHPLTHEGTALYGQVFCELFPSKGEEVWGGDLVNLRAYEKAIGKQIAALREESVEFLRGKLRFPDRADGAKRIHR